MNEVQLKTHKLLGIKIHVLYVSSTQLVSLQFYGLEVSRNFKISKVGSD